VHTPRELDGCCATRGSPRRGRSRYSASPACRCGSRPSRVGSGTASSDPAEEDADNGSGRSWTGAERGPPGTPLSCGQRRPPDDRLAIITVYHLARTCQSVRCRMHAQLVDLAPRTQNPAHFPQFSTCLNTRPCDLPLRGDFTGLRGQAALQVPEGREIPVNPSPDRLRRPPCLRQRSWPRPVSRRALRIGGVKGSNESLNALARRLNAELPPKLATAP
jgi:hypothetical protein